MNSVKVHCPYCQGDLKEITTSNWLGCDRCKIILSLRTECKYSDCSSYNWMTGVIDTSWHVLNIIKNLLLKALRCVRIVGVWQMNKNVKFDYFKWTKICHKCNKDLENWYKNYCLYCGEKRLTYYQTTQGQKMFNLTRIKTLEGSNWQITLNVKLLCSVWNVD